MAEDVVVVGLGNPGTRYEQTLHNVGYKVVERLAAKNGWSFEEEARHSALVAKGERGGKKFHLLKPLTFMNLSGDAVGSYLAFYKLPVEALIVVVDDADLPLGDFRFREEGGHGGHNGLKNIGLRLGTNRFKRARIGIGRDPMLPLADYVLKSQDEKVWNALLPAIDQALSVIEEMKFNGVNR